MKISLAIAVFGMVIIAASAMRPGGRGKRGRELHFYVIVKVYSVSQNMSVIFYISLERDHRGRICASLYIYIQLEK